MSEDTRYINGPCQLLGRHHHWGWTGKRYECERCECVAFDLKWADTPCLICGHKAEWRFTCNACLDACLDLDEDYVPFEEVNHDREL